MTRLKLDDPRLYLNRHMQWLAFNERVLEEARDQPESLPSAMPSWTHR